MRMYTLMIVSAGLLIGADAPKDDAGKKELKKLVGTWAMASGEQKGEKIPEQVAKKASLTITGDKHTVKVGEDTIIGTHALDPSKKPGTIDAMDTEGPYKGKTVLGIYKVEGDEFTVCFAPPGKERPKEFTTKSGSAELLHVWKRLKE